MKKSFWGITVVLLTLLSCRSDEESLQKIDQVFNLYIKDSSGKDLLNPIKVGSFTGVSWNDELADTDIANVNFSRKMLADSTYYAEYTDGATRQLYDGTDPDNKIYRSEIQVSLIKKISDTQNAPVDIDTLEIYYRMSPSVFEVSKVYYNKVLKFSKTSDEPNVVTIIK
ncbi:MAG: hypothetical protein DI622_00785 [Chryseobacterium sp.]|uniref:hypothetical protein n=1 Tax=unclassified Chryseobacterium TaxID=2593645 RepID=UPI000DB51E6C|nr:MULTISPECIES: hypothetical protein [unclassified Chryseobacterium]MPS63575.1 hypothetical protein [Chryseobacterium sp.]PZU26454.1 MAG: hypothetical protein DI622_00785 [Chryseobacterium sp.]UMQ40949.1 hypothetical protein MKS83_16275 [Chryseobacterium sp. Y16C]